MQLFNYLHREDFGHEWFVQIFKICKNFCVLDVSAQWDEFPSPELLPLLLVNFGSKSLCGFCFRWKWLEVSGSFLVFQPRDFRWYKKYEINGTK